jgi:prepilin-type N-terminal cleavage/methylation domain-containing protein
MNSVIPFLKIGHPELVEGPDWRGILANLSPSHRSQKEFSLFRFPFLKGSTSRGFTLLEICIVLVILGVLMGVIAPGMQSALAEQALRSDARQLSLMVKTAMLRTCEEHRPYVLDLSETSLSLAPLSDAPSSDDLQTWPLNARNQLLLPDPKSSGDWLQLHSAEWIFRPGELCPASAVCFVRGPARLQMSFNALTGNVENERSFIP